MMRREEWWGRRVWLLVLVAISLPGLVSAGSTLVVVGDVEEGRVGCWKYHQLTYWLLIQNVFAQAIRKATATAARCCVGCRRVGVCMAHEQPWEHVLTCFALDAFCKARTWLRCMKRDADNSAYEHN